MTNFDSVIRLYTQVNGVRTALPYFIIKNDAYTDLVATAVTQNGKFPMIDGNIDDGIHNNTFGIRNNKVVYIDGSNELTLENHLAFLAEFDENKTYEQEDIVTKDNVIYSRLTAGQAAWNTDDWVALVSGHTLTDLNFQNEDTGKYHNSPTGALIQLDDVNYVEFLVVPGDSLIKDLFEPKPQVTDIVFLGASLSEGLVASRASMLRRSFAQNGLTIESHDESTGGRHVEQIFDHWESVKANYTAMGDKCIVFCLDFIVNNITPTHPYTSMTDQYRTDMIAKINELVASIKANGNIPLFSEITFLGYDEDEALKKTWDLESNGSLPYNENIVYPLLKSLEPMQWSHERKLPYISQYNYAFNYGQYLFDEVAPDDRIHYNEMGYHLNRRFIVDSITNWIKGEAPIVIEKSSTEDAKNFVPVPMPATVAIAGFVTSGPSINIPFLNVIDTEADHTDKPMVPKTGYVPTSLTISSVSAGITYTENGFDDDANYSIELESNTMKKRYAFHDTNSYVEVFTIGGLNPGQAVDFNMLSFRSGNIADVTRFLFNTTTETADNFIEVETDEAANKYIGKASEQMGALPVADGQGKITVYMKRHGGGGTRAVLNGFEVIPQ